MTRAALLIAGLILSGCGNGHDPRRHSHGSHDRGKHDHGKDAPSPRHGAGSKEKPYPLKTCVVSGEELGSRGEPVIREYKGHDIKLCCENCDEDFQKDPEKYAKKVGEAWRQWHESSSPAGQAAISTAVGDTVPDFEVTDFAGKTWKLSDLRKQAESGVVSLTFWCTFCHSCRMMDERFQKLAVELKSKVAVVGVDASAADTAKKIQEFARLKGFTAPVYLDVPGKVADLFGVKLTTTTMVIDRAGVLRYRGQFDGQGVPHAQNAIKALLQGKEVAVKETTPAG